jgi:hypothetical protein
MAKIVKVKNNTWETIDGGLCVIFRGQDSLRREVAMAVPAGALKILWADALRRLGAEKTKSERRLLPPQWHQVNFLSAQTALVGTTDNQRVGVILDQGIDTEFGLSIAREDARELGRQLIAEADKLPHSTKPQMN